MAFGDKDGIFDDFWDLASMMPKKKKPILSKTQSSTITFADIRVDEKAQEAPSVSLPPPKKQAAPAIEYTPVSPFIESVRLYAKPKGYSFYSNFVDDARHYFGRIGAPCDHVPYFSYIPQYAQMTKEQKSFYFYFRSCAQAGEFIPCDVTYVWLYIYEIINLPDLILPSEGVISLCRLWKAYRAQNPKMDKYMTVWLADYCLVHKLPCPYEWIKDFLPAIMENAGFKEFYLGRASEMNEYGVHTLLSLLSTYDIEKSRFIKNLDAQSKGKMLCALVPVLKRHLSKEREAFKNESLSVLTRDAFTGSLCAQNVKYRIEVTYRSFSHSESLSVSVTAALKYAENKMRILAKQKSRVAVSSLDPEDGALIDAYFDRIAPKTAPKKQVPEYEKLYDAESQGISFADAKAIESASWENTKLLTVEEEIEQPATAAPAVQETKEQTSMFTKEESELLKKLLERDLRSPAFDTVALAEAINEKTTEEMGDVVIELSEDALCLREDYREDIEIWLKNK